jgi:hypothetical protein
MYKWLRKNVWPDKKELTFRNSKIDNQLKNPANKLKKKSKNYNSK